MRRHLRQSHDDASCPALWAAALRAAQTRDQIAPEYKKGTWTPMGSDPDPLAAGAELVMDCA
jgi:hypothetical protein